MQAECEVLTAAEAAKLLRVSVWTIYEMCQRGEIPHGRVGRVLRFHRGTLIAHLAQGPNPHQDRRGDQL